VDALSILFLLTAGGIAGFLAGFFGVGGGIILVPILLYYFQSIGVSSLVATHMTLGTSLLVVVFASSTSAYQYAANRHVVWKAVLIMGVASVAGAAVGSTVAASLQGKTLQQIFATVVAIAAVRLLAEASRPAAERELRTAPRGLILTGVIVGLVSSLAGVGGGVFSIPIMYYLLKFPLKKALGTSSATIVITALAAAIGYAVRGQEEVARFAPEMASYTLGFVDYVHSLPVIVGTLPAAKYGAMVSHRTHVDVLRRVYGVFLLAIAGKMFFF
jgi:uncharacterized membrane protein YfcA